MKSLIPILMSLVLMSPANGDVIKVLFSPRGGIEAEICARIKAAKKSVYVMAYDLTSTPIANALLEAQGRRISINVVADRVRSLSPNSEVPRLARMGCHVTLDGKHRIMHSKVMVFDQDTVVTGSYNWTKGAITNTENVIVIEDAGIAHIYLNNFYEHWSHGVNR